jgi:DNA-binding MarR family transcriptional regulator
LLDARALVVATGGKGRLRIDVDKAPLRADLLGPPAAVLKRSETMTMASVRLYECGIQTDMNTGFHEHGVRFADARLKAHWGYQAEYTQTALRDAGLSDPPPWEAPTLASPASELEWPRQAASAVGALGVAALIVRFLMAFFTRFTVDDFAQHPTRRAVLDAVRRRPGIPLPEIMHQRGFTRAQVRHHIKILERSRQIDLVRTWRGLVLFPAGHAGTRTAEVMNLAHAPELLGLIKRRPGIHVTGASERLGLPKARISQIATPLESAGLVRRVRAGRRVTLHLT